jgi:hypothetical protein
MSKYGNIRTGISYNNQSRILKQLSSKKRTKNAKNGTGKDAQIQISNIGYYMEVKTDP